MKIKINKEVEVCDFCQRETYLQICIVCKKEFCILCKGIGYNPYNQKICKECIKKEDVEKIITHSKKSYNRNYLKQKASLGILQKGQK
jgi:hypothetical protein